MNKIPYIEKGHHEGINFQRERKKYVSFILYGYIGLILVFFIVLILRLFQLTVVKGAYYRRLAEENRMREVVIEPRRGAILDRKGIVLAQSTVADVHGQDLRLTSQRRYFMPEAFAHLLGYRQQADEKDFQQDPCMQKLKIGDKIGKKAIEKAYECDLRGIHGKKLVEVTAGGEALRTLSILPARDGETIQIAADANLQEKAYNLIKDTRAVVVGLRPQTGEVLILTSSPSFNPQYFEDGAGKEVEAYFTNPEKPLFNRATEGVYPPGSTFKLVVASGALEEKKIDEKTIVEDTGVIKSGEHTFGNWYFLEHGKTEGSVDLIKALRRSNDIYFYKVGERLGAQGIKKWAELFGYGKKLLPLLDGAEGTLPSPFWKEDTLKEQWYLGDTYNFSIGQGYLLTTPLQVALMTSVYANNGFLCKPSLLKISTDEADCTKLPLAATNIQTMIKGMEEACTTGGTGWPFFEFTVTNSAGKKQPMKVACKTGTAESHGESTKPHAWFTVYAPIEHPEIILTVMVEEAGQGSDVAGPIAKEILTNYFGREQ